ncbi:MAG: GxxExxY protein [Segetibacter sp.]
MNFDELTYKVRGAIFEVFKEMGPGLLESVYEAALFFELRSIGFQVSSQVPVPVTYKANNLELGFRLDLLIENEVIVGSEVRRVFTPNS